MMACPCIVYIHDCITDSGTIYSCVKFLYGLQLAITTQHNYSSGLSYNVIQIIANLKRSFRRGHAPRLKIVLKICGDTCQHHVNSHAGLTFRSQLFAGTLF